MNADNKTNTYINFKTAGSDNDWCYLRQIGTTVNIYKLALIFTMMIMMRDFVLEEYIHQGKTQI